MSGIKDVAAKAGVSISTVSNVLNKSKYVSPELVARVEDAVAELNYEVNSIAASMKSKKSGTIGVITEDMCGVFYPYVIRGINTIADEKGYRVILCDVNGMTGKSTAIERERELFHKLVASQVDGIIFASSMLGEYRDQYLSELKKSTTQKNKKIPIVSMERDLTKWGIDSVYFDGYENAKKAVQHLVDCGCKKICHIAGPGELQIAQERIEGYKTCAKENHIKLDESSMIVHGDYTHRSGYLRMEELLENVPDLEGVFCGNDQMAIGALRLLREKGIKVPEDVKLIGYDDVFISTIVEPPISTIHIQKDSAGRKAAEILFDRIERPTEKDSEEKPIGVKLESRLVIRKSTMDGVDESWNINDW